MNIFKRISKYTGVAVVSVALTIAPACKSLTPLEQEAVVSQVEGVVDTIAAVAAPFFPGAAAIGVVGTGLIRMFFPRPRKHAVNVLKELSPFHGPLAPIDAAKSVFKAYGLLHSHQNPEDMLAALEKLAAKSGKVVMQNGSGKVEIHDTPETPA
jgi:hypothetical protein